MSKKSVGLLIFIFFLTLLFLAATLFSTTGVVVESDDTGVLMKDEDGMEYSIPLFKNDYSINQKTVVIHTGGILETYPARFQKVIMVLKK